MAGCSAELTMVTIVAAEWTGIPQPVGTTAIAATANPLVRMKWEVRRRVRHPEQISQVCSQSDRKLTNVQKPLDGNRQGRRRQRHGAQVLTSDSSHPTKSIALTTVGCRGQVPGDARIAPNGLLLRRNRLGYWVETNFCCNAHAREAAVSSLSPASSAQAQFRSRMNSAYRWHLPAGPQPYRSSDPSHSRCRSPRSPRLHHPSIRLLQQRQKEPTAASNSC